MKTLFMILAAAAVIAPVVGAQAQQVPAYANAAVASPDRPAADVARDALRKPAELVTFAGIKPGDRVADIMPGNGYFTRIFSKAAGPDGRVFAIVPSEFLKLSAKAGDAAKAIPTDAFSNVVPLISPVADIATPEPLDVAWTSDNYHDIYGSFGADKTAQLDVAVFKALKPGGVFIVVDHVAKAGTSDTSAKGLHRIDPDTVKMQALMAGFTLEAETPILKNAADPHDAVIFSPAIRGHTDQFALRFRKPGA